MVRAFGIREVVLLTGENYGTLRNDRRRHHMCAAFGAVEPVPEHWLLVDMVALGIRDQLTDHGLPRKAAVWVVRHFFDQWAMCVSRIEHDQTAMLFMVVENLDGKCWAAHGPTEGLPEFMRGLERVKRIFPVNVARVVANIMQHAADEHITIGAFFYPPGHEFWQSEWLADYRQAVEKAAAHMRNIKPTHAHQRLAQERALCALH